MHSRHSISLVDTHHEANLVGHRDESVNVEPKLLRPVPQGLLFEPDNVLYDATCWRRWLFQLLRRIGVHGEFTSLFYVWDHEYLPEVHCGRRDFQTTLRTFLQALGLSRGQVDEVAAAQAKRRQLGTDLRPLPRVKSTLQALASRKMALGVLGDSTLDAEHLNQRLERIGLAKYFSTIVSSRDVQHAKPDPECYEAGLAALGLTADAAAFVGCDRQHLWGAQRVGMRPIAVSGDDGVDADLRVDRFDGLLRLVGEPFR
jgi:HAD superfamily hydrolase (TIGR01509 family)